MSRSVDVVIIGSGNVAEAFARAVSGTEGLYLRQIFARNRERGEYLACECGTKWCGEAEELAEADLYIIAISDRAVESVARSLRFRPGAMVVHTAGSVPLAALPEQGRQRYYSTAAAHFTTRKETK